MKDTAAPVPAMLPVLPLAESVKCGPIRGAVGDFRMVRIADLWIDDTYQRAMTAASVRNVRRICAAFDWAKFLPVVVVESGGGLAVIDGQHRATAAATLGIDRVPAYVLHCSRAEAAGAFAAINGAVTPVSAVDVWFAELAAGAPEALALDRTFQAADVRIVRAKAGIAVGETASIGVLRRAADRYGLDTLCTVLQCITQTGNGNPGTIVGAVVNGIARALMTKPDLLAEPSRAFDIFDTVDLMDVLERARLEFATTRQPAQHIVTRQINDAIRRSR